MPVRRRRTTQLVSPQSSNNRSSYHKAICRTQYPRSRYRPHWSEKLAELPDDLLSHCMLRIHCGETNKSIAAWLVAQPNLGGCAHLAQETIRTYLAPLRDEVELRDRLLARHLHQRDRARARYRRQMHQAQRAFEREAAKTAASIKIDHAYASAGETTPPSPPAAPPPSGPAAPAPPEGGGPIDPTKAPATAVNGNEPSAVTETVRDGEPSPLPATPKVERDVPSKWFRPKLELLLAKNDQLEICKLLQQVQAHRVTRMLSLEEIMPVALDQTRKEMLVQLKMCQVAVEIDRKTQKDVEFNPIDGSVGARGSASENRDEFARAVDHLAPAEYDKALTLTRLISEFVDLRKKHLPLPELPDGNDA